MSFVRMCRMTMSRNIVLIILLGFFFVSFVKFDAYSKRNRADRGLSPDELSPRIDASDVTASAVKSKTQRIQDGGSKYVEQDEREMKIKETIVEDNGKKVQERSSAINTKLASDLQKMHGHLSNLLKLKMNTQVLREIRSISSQLENVMRGLGLGELSAKKSEQEKELLVCPEKYTKSTAGYPFFYNGWDLENCKNVPKFSTVLSICMNVMNKDQDFVNEKLVPILFAIAKNYSGITVHVASDKKIPEDKIKLLDLNLKQHSGEIKDKSPGGVWNYLVSQVKTSYVLVAKDFVHFLALDARLERLVREIDSLEVDFVGAASRDFQGHWSMNCLQMEMKNYSLSFTPGYHLSEHECLYCDITAGSFVSKTKFLKSNSFDTSLAEDVLFYDFFINQNLKNSKTVVCPDSMFYVNKMESTRNTVSKWLPIAKKHTLHSIALSRDEKIQFSCGELNLSCQKASGTALSPCCLQELADMIKYFMKTCEDKGLVCELQEGTLLGAVKLGKVLPWERDADLTFLSANYSALKGLSQHFRNAGYGFSQGSDLWCCADGRKAGGTGTLTSPGWHAELYGQHLMDTEKLQWLKLPPTKILFDGMWVNVPRNPGMFARNRYGHEIYRHAQHWMTLGHSTGWDLYKPSTFSECFEPGSHWCLDQYSVDGNIQFQRL